LKVVSIVKEARTKLLPGDSDTALAFVETPELKFQQEAVGATILVVGLRRSITMKDQSVVQGIQFNPEATYRQLDNNGKAWGVRLRSSVAARYGYGQYYEAMALQLKQAKSIRPVDASTWADLLDRAKDAETTPASEQLGYDELDERGPNSPANPSQESQDERK